jgi:hypothetical protein
VTILLGLSLALLGVWTGIYVATLIHDRRITDLSASEYVAMHQMRDKTFRKVMPVLGLAMVGLVAASTLLAFAPGLPFRLGGMAALLLLADIALTVTRQMPLNQRIQSWQKGTAPEEWREVRDAWAHHHHARTILGGAAYVLFLVATLMTVAH